MIFIAERTDILTAALLDADVAIPAARVSLGRSIRAVPRFDEDVLTLMAEAALGLCERHAPSAMVVASVSGPFAEGGSAPILAEMLGLDGLTLELGGAVTAGAEALAAGMALVTSGIAPVLVIAADHRVDPTSRPLGAGAVALVLDTEGEGGELTLKDATTGWFPDAWRTDGEDSITFGDRSFASVSPAVRTSKAGERVSGPIGFDIERVGNLGCAGLAASMLLDAPRKNSERTFVAAASGSTRRFTFRGGSMTAQLKRRAEAARAGGVESSMPPTVDLDEFDPYASEPRSWRERGQDLRLEGVRDPATGEVFYPPIPSIPGRPLETFPLSRTGTVFTHTRDHVFPLGGPISMVVVDLDGGGRFLGQTAWDFPVEIGMKVRLVPRLLHRGGGLPHYFWKVVSA